MTGRMTTSDANLPWFYWVIDTHWHKCMRFATETAQSKVLVGVPHRCRSVHHAQHRRAPGFQESPDQQSRENEKCDVEPRRVVPSDGSIDHPRVPLGGDKTEHPEYQLDNQRRSSHRSVERREQKGSHLQSVVFAIDIQNRKDDQIGEDERDHATETDSAVPQYGSQRNIPDRAYERDDRHQRAYNRSPNRGNDRV